MKWNSSQKNKKKNYNKKSIVFSSPEFTKILNRIIKIFPDFEQKYKKDFAFINQKISSNQISIQEIKNQIIQSIQKAEKLQIETNLQFVPKKNIDSIDDQIQEIISAIKNKFVEEKINKNVIILEETMAKNIKANKKKINIAIDGPAGSGKSTVAKIIAKKIGYKYINTGLVYRTIAYHAIKKQINYKDEVEVINSLKNAKINLNYNEQVFLNDVDISNKIRTSEVSYVASKVAMLKKVRKYAVRIQQKMGQIKGVVMDGRDTTFVILPKAELKIFLDSSVEERAKRRMIQNQKLGLPSDYKKILEQLKIRDYQDRHREKDPMHKTEDAILIDATYLSLNQVVEKILKLINQKIRE